MKKDKFSTLVHNGVVFPKQFEGYPEDIKNKSDFLKSLSLLGQEMFFHYAVKRDTDYVKDSVFNKNFWHDFKREFPIKYQTMDFPKDFKKEIDIIFEWNEKQKEQKKLYNKEHKEEIKKEKEEIKSKFGIAILDGKEQPIGTYTIEAGGIFMGRGKCPIRGHWKYQAQPEDIEINYIGPEENIPKPPKGHHWKKVVQNKNAFEIGYYEIDVGHKTKKPKHLLFAMTSDIKKDADQKKYEKALKLIKNWDTVEKYIFNGLKSSNKKTRESAAIAWLIQNTAIRVGNERGEFESQEVVGASTLKIKNIELFD